MIHEMEDGEHHGAAGKACDWSVAASFCSYGYLRLRRLGSFFPTVVANGVCSRVSRRHRWRHSFIPSSPAPLPIHQHQHYSFFITSTTPHSSAPALFLSLPPHPNSQHPHCTLIACGMSPRCRRFLKGRVPKSP